MDAMRQQAIRPVIFTPRTRSLKDNYTDQINIAIYGRVSTEHEEQLSAFENQMQWYSMILNSHKNWNVVATYTDKKTGTSAKARKDFMQMIDDALNGKFSLIISREVCRWKVRERT